MADFHAKPGMNDPNLETQEKRTDCHASGDKFQEAFGKIGHGFAQFAGRVKNVDYAKLGAKIADHVKEHPYQTTFQIGSAVFPGLVAEPALGLLGFGSGGIVAGPSFPLYQAKEFCS